VPELPLPLPLFSSMLRKALGQAAGVEGPRVPGAAQALYDAVAKCAALGRLALPLNKHSRVPKQQSFSTIPAPKFENIVASCEAFLLRKSAGEQGEALGGAAGATPGAPATKARPKTPAAIEKAAAKALEAAKNKEDKAASKAAAKAAKEAEKAAAAALVKAALEAARLQREQPDTPAVYEAHAQSGRLMRAHSMVGQWEANRRRTALTDPPEHLPATLSPLRLIVAAVARKLAPWAVVCWTTPVLSSAFSDRFRPPQMVSPEFAAQLSALLKHEQDGQRDRVARNSAHILVVTGGDALPTVEAVLTHVRETLHGAPFVEGFGHAALREAVAAHHLPAAMQVRATPSGHALLHRDTLPDPRH